MRDKPYLIAVNVDGKQHLRAYEADGTGDKILDVELDPTDCAILITDLMKAVRREVGRKERTGFWTPWGYAGDPAREPVNV